MNTTDAGPNTQKSEADTMETSEGLMVAAYPNPFSNNLNIEVSTDHATHTTLRIFNIFGEELWRQEQYLEAGRNLLHWTPAVELAAGVYSIHVMDEDGCRSVSKVVYSAR